MERSEFFINKICLLLPDIKILHHQEADLGSDITGARAKVFQDLVQYKISFSSIKMAVLQPLFSSVSSECYIQHLLISWFI